MSLDQTPYLVVNYHGLGAMPSWVQSEEAFYWCEDAGAFAAHLDVMAEHSSCSTVQITFDDGNASDFEIATPALVERGLTADFFVCAGRIGQDRYLDATAIRDMRAAGMGIGSHGWGHVDWRRASDSELEQEIEGATKKLEDTLGEGVDSVAIPFGSYDRRVMRRLGSFRTVFTSDRGFARGGKRILPRMAYTRDWTASTIPQLASAPPTALAQIKHDLVMTLKRNR
jgi:peptidoglycan/xylan/chitin deacetylase (PgdA/CDA1 family)